MAFWTRVEFVNPEVGLARLAVGLALKDLGLSMRYTY